MGYIELNREVQGIGECSFCGGIAFYFEVEQLDLTTCVTPELIRKLRRKVKDGATLQSLFEEYPDELIIEKRDVSICEKCGREESWPKHGGA